MFDFAYDAAAPARAVPALTVNGQAIEEGRIDKTVPVYFSTDDTSDIGQGWGTPMSDTYEPPFAFIGKVKKVTVQAKSP